MKDTVKIRNNMWCNAQCVAIAAFAIENQATRLQYDIGCSLQENGELIVEGKLFDDITAEIQNLSRYFEELKNEYEEYNRGKD